MRCLGMDGAATPFYNYERAFRHTRGNRASEAITGRDVRVAQSDPRKGLN